MNETNRLRAERLHRAGDSVLRCLSRLQQIGIVAALVSVWLIVAGGVTRV